MSVEFTTLWLSIGMAMALGREMPLRWVAACWGYYE